MVFARIIVVMMKMYFKDIINKTHVYHSKTFVSFTNRRGKKPKTL